MKRIFLMMCMTLMSVCTFAQEGSKWIGANVRYNANKYKTVGVGAKYQWQCFKYARLEGSAGYMLKTNNYQKIDATANVHLLVNLGKENLNFYPIGGISFSHEITKEGHLMNNSEPDSELYYSTIKSNGFKYLLGAGIEFPVTEDVKISAEFHSISLEKNELALGFSVRL